MKLIFKVLKTKTGGEQEAIIVPGRCVITHNIDLDTYLYSSKRDWIGKYTKTRGKWEGEIEVTGEVVEAMMEIGEHYTDPRGKIHNIENEAFRETFQKIAAAALDDARG